MNRVYDYNTKKEYQEKVSNSLHLFYDNIIGRIILKCLISKPITSVGSWYMNSKLSKLKIKKFINKNHINMEEYYQKEFKSFNDFFIRDIKEEYRVIDKNKNTFISPADSKLSIYTIDDNISFKIKNSIYTVEELLQDKQLAKKYQDGLLLIFRLSVDDYHHYIFIDDGKVEKTKEIKGKYHTVNPIAMKKYKVFSENHRIVNILSTKNFGDMIYVEVGALMVGKIVNRNVKKFTKGEEKGYFCFGGSTIAILLEKDQVKINEDILKYTNKDIEVKIKMGQIIGKKR